MIEKPVYHQIHGLVFSGGKSSNKQRKMLKELFYDSYYNYVYRGKNVDVEKFNKKLYAICSSYEVRDLDMTTVIEKETGELLLTDEKPFFVDENKVQQVSESFIKDETVQQQITRFKELDYYQVNNDHISEELNLALVKNSCFVDLVDFIGYHRCFSILKKFIYSDRYRIFEKSEFEFIRYSLSFIAKYRLRFKNINYDYICGTCGNIGTHKASKIEKRICFESEWFNEDGILQLTKSVDDVSPDQYIIDNKVTTYAGLKYFRYGMIHVDQFYPYKFHSLVNGNNNYIAFNNFVSDIDKLGIQPLQINFICSDDYLLLTNMINSLKTDFCSDQWLDYFNQTKNQWEIVFNKICNADLGNQTSSISFNF